MDDVITLVKTIYTRDEVGNMKPGELPRDVLCQVNSVSRAEFYSAAQADMHPEYVFILSHFKDYEGEKFIKYMDWIGTEHKLYVTRVYRVPGTDRLEITAEERARYGDKPGSRSERCPD